MLGLQLLLLLFPLRVFFLLGLAPALFIALNGSTFGGLLGLTIFPAAIFGAASFIKSVLVVAAFMSVTHVSAFIVAVASIAFKVTLALAVVRVVSVSTHNDLEVEQFMAGQPAFNFSVEVQRHRLARVPA